jgi:hypothetical protein
MDSNSGSIDVGTVSVNTWARSEPTVKHENTSKIILKVRDTLHSGEFKVEQIKGDLLKGIVKKNVTTACHKTHASS